MNAHGRPLSPSGLTQFYGSEELTIAEAGDIVTDRFGLSTGTCVYQAPRDKVIRLSDSLLRPGVATHPYAPYLTLEKKRVVLSPGNATVVCDFAGCESDSDYVYEFEAGAKEEPIQTHPDFPLFQRQYGILFSPSSGNTYYGNNRYLRLSALAKMEHVRFQARSPLAGVEAFMDFSNGVYKATKTTNIPPTEALASIGTINTPPGNPPHFTSTKAITRVTAPSIFIPPGEPGRYHYEWLKARFTTTPAAPRDWLYMGFSSSQRGSAYTVTHMWLLSGIGGWNRLIYSESDLDLSEDEITLVDEEADE
jgi:hypothetical protein